MSKTFQNPLFSVSAADPFVFYYGDQYYCLYTIADRIRIYRSSNIEDIASGEYKDVYMAGAEVDGHIWAPELHRIGERWYIYSSGSRFNRDFGSIRLFCLESEGDDPFGDYHFKAFTDDHIHGLDATVWQDKETGKLYTAYSEWRFGDEGQVLCFAEMDNPWTIGQRRFVISRATYDWETNGAVEGKDSRVNEGPIFLERNGKLFLIYSASGCWSRYYCLGMLEFAGGDIMDQSSWKKSEQPIFKEGNGVYGVGHNSFFQSPDGTETWIAYHGMSDPDAGEAGRYMYLQPLQFDENDRPVLGEPLSRDTDITAPAK